MTALNIPGVFGIAAAALALLLLVKVALSPPADRTGKVLLLIFLAGFLSMAANSLYFLLGLHLALPHFSFLYVFLMAWIGPSLWFYTARVLGLSASPLDSRGRWHWLPGIVLQLALLPYLLLPAKEKLDFLYSTTGKWVFLGVYLSIYFQIAAYALVIQRAMTRHRAQVAATEEREGLRVDLAWINVVCYGFVGFVALDGVVPHLNLTPPGASYAMAMGLYLLIIVTVFHATAHGRVYPFVARKAANDSKYVHSGLRDDTARHYVGKLERLMQEAQPHLESDLSLDKLAALLKIHPHYLSQILNDDLGKNFYDYVNEQRIAHARQLLLQQPDLPIIDVAVACGYNNRNSFNNSFRRFVGMTPTDFRQQGGKTGVTSTETR